MPDDASQVVTYQAAAVLHLGQRVRGTAMAVPQSSYYWTQCPTSGRLHVGSSQVVLHNTRVKPTARLSLASVSFLSRASHMSTCPKILLLLLAGPAAELRDFVRKRRNKHRTMDPISPSPPPESVDQDANEAPLEEPLVERLRREIVNPQQSSPLFNGRIPPEVRNRIFEFVLTEDEDTLYNQDTHYTQPGYGSHKSLLTNLLLTCRQVYLEAHHLPLVNREHVFWHHREPEGSATKTKKPTSPGSGPTSSPSCGRCTSSHSNSGWRAPCKASASCQSCRPSRR
jgi:hypothetical protein